MERYVCVHAHFYQPPRENPWLEEIEYQDSAYPYHDWNERISAECYAPNATSRILDEEGRIEEIVNNYSRISFNIGPTLLSWMEEKDPATYRAIREADRESRDRFCGHGSALAQAYNHMILPLANRRDKATQVKWGIRDFEHRFGRAPEGMWLPETAVDLESLEILAEHGIRFTVLAPRQGFQVRKLGGKDFRDVSGDRIDPTMPYRIVLPSGKTIGLFFYDGPISRAVAFEGLLFNGETFANRLMGGFSTSRTRRNQLVHIATDGESYGHHHKHGEMALSYALHRLQARGLARITNYGEYLERFPPTHEVRIHENSSWSCVHGIERWKGNCGCSSGGRPGWDQEWRGPLREALDGLRDAVREPFERRAGELLRDPWAARDGYVELLLDRSREAAARFFGEHASRPLSPEEESTALKLLEMQRHAMLMYTSCGWFFDELSGIETVQVIQYAGRVVQLADSVLGGNGVEAGFLERLARAKSNLPEPGNGRAIYEKWVRPAMVDLEKVGAHYAISSLFESYGERTRIFCYDAEREDYRVLPAGKSRLALGRARISSRVTQEASTVSFGVLHLGDHNVSGGVREYRGEEAYEALVREVSDIFRSADLPEVIRAVDRNFGSGTYSLKLLFRDEQRKILEMILEKTLADAESSYRQMYEQNAPLMRFLSEIGHPMPSPFRLSAEVALNTQLREALASEEPDLDRVRGLLYEKDVAGTPLDAGGLSLTLRRTLERLAHRFRENPQDLPLLERFEAAVGMARDLPFEVVLWEAQNVCYEMSRTVFPEFLRRSWEGDEAAGEWIRRFLSLGERLSVKVSQG